MVVQIRNEKNNQIKGGTKENRKNTGKNSLLLKVSIPSRWIPSNLIIGEVVAGKPHRPFVLQGIEEIPSRFTVSSNLESVDQLEADTSHSKNLASTITFGAGRGFVKASNWSLDDINLTS